MNRRLFVRLLGALVLMLAIVLFVQGSATAGKYGSAISLEPIGTYETGIFDESAAEIPAYDSATQRLFVVNAEDASVDVLDISDPTTPTKLFAIDATELGDGANSVAVYNGLVAVAIEAEEVGAAGLVAFYDVDGNLLNTVPAGALPDMVTFTPNGKFVLVANEGEPNDEYDVDPEGSVTVINLTKGVAMATAKTADFTAFNDANLDDSIRIFGPNASVAQDLEPEYIAVSKNSRFAYVAMQENNALAVIDVRKAKVLRLVGLGFKDHSLPGNGLDASDRDDVINIANWPIYGIPHPDAIATYTYRGRTFIITANEGDARDYDGFSEEERIKDIELDETAFPNADDLQEDEQIGRLNITTTLGDTDGDGDFDALYAYGTRSFSIYSSNGKLVYDSGDLFEQITAEALPNDFNSNNDENDSFESRSDNKGPEPEGVTIGKIGRSTYAFIGLERVGGIMVFDITRPHKAQFVQYINNRDFSGDAEAGTAGDLGPEGLIFIDAKESPNGKPLLVVANEVSGTTTIFQINK